MPASALLVEALHELADILEARGEYYYETENVKLFVPDADACEICEDAADLGWIPDEDTYEGVFGEEDGPPLHPHCFLSGTEVAAAGNISAHTSRPYKGEIVVFGIPGVHQLSCTPNHPILTRRGWVSAADLKPSDYVLQCVRPDRVFALLYPDNNYVETCIEQIARSLLMSGGSASHGVPISTEAFHGDGCPNGKVDIVWAARTLLNNLREGPQHSHNRLLRRRQSQRMPFSVEGPLAKIFRAALHSADSIVSGLGVSSFLLERQRIGPENSSLRSTSLLQSEVVPAPSYGDPGNPDTGSDLIHALTGDVRFVQLSKIERRYFDGHVYNLETPAGFYCANTIIAHNCGCTLEYRERRIRIYV